MRLPNGIVTDRLTRITVTHTFFSGMDWHIDRILYQKEKPLGMKLLLFPLYLLSLPYEGAVRLRSFLYAHHVLKSNRLPCPVISVGNITVGGTGKTPLVMALVRYLQSQGISVAVLSRGYKGKGATDPVVSDGPRTYLSLEEAGDEPSLMARSLKDTPILVGRDRFAIARIALRRFPVQGFILDDGFQHLRIHRDLNIVLVDSTVGFGDNHLLPRGILREPLAHLDRTDLFVLTKVEDPEVCKPLETFLQKIRPSTPIFHSHYEPSGLLGPRGEQDPLDAFRGKKVLALSGIANPLSFSTLLKKCGMEVIKRVVFSDHHRFTPEDLAVLDEKRNDVDWIVTTEKDLVKLETLEIRHLQIRALQIDMRVWEEAFYQKVTRLFKNEGERSR